MASLKEATAEIKERLEDKHRSLITDGTIKQLIFGKKNKGKLELPNLKIVLGDAQRVNESLGSIGNRSEYKADLVLISTVKNTDDPWLGDVEALDILTKSLNIILADRHLGIPDIVSRIEDNSIKIDPDSWNDKVTLYKRGSVLNLNFIVDNY